jgi:peptide/nickel transport system permease protein
VNFALPRLVPGDIFDVLYGDERITPETREMLMARFGLNKPVITQYWLYITNTLRGEWGRSVMFFPTPVSKLIWQRLPYTLALLWIATLITAGVGYLLGVIAGWRAGSKTDSTIQGFSLALLAAPVFWLGMILLFIFGYRLDWFPLSGAKTAAYHASNWFAWLFDWGKHAFLPILSMALHFGTSQLIMRNTLVSTLREHYILTAKAKGLSDRTVMYKHAARNALLPVVTGIMMRFSMVIAGSVLIETVFSYPGMGRLMFQAVQNLDYQMIQGCFFMLSVVAIATVFIIDLVYLFLDPRIRY